tara:strand:- start:368 stop:1588 length:1221 start_codon:yes stop_codon:yes gene_type:complete
MSAPGLQRQLAEARKAQLRRQRKDDADSLGGTPHQQAIEEIEDLNVGMTLSESDLLDLASLYGLIRSDDQVLLRRMPRGAAERRAYIRENRPEKLEHVFPRWWEMTEAQKNTLLQGEDPFDTNDRVTGNDVYYPENLPGVGYQRPLPTIAAAPLAIYAGAKNRLNKRGKQQERSQQDMLSRIRGTPHEVGSGGAYNRGYWTKAEEIRNLPAEDLLLGLTTGQLYGEDFLGTGVSREIGDIHSSFVPGYTQFLTGGPEDAPRGTHTGSPFSTEEKLMPRGEKLTELSERLGGLELQQYLIQRNQRNKSKFMRLQKRMQRGEITPEQAQEEGLHLLGMKPKETGVAPAEPQAQAQPQIQQQQQQPPRAEEPNTQSPPAIQTPSPPRRRSYKRNPTTGDYLYPIISEEP